MIRTGGGAFNPTEAPIYFLAYGGFLPAVAEAHTHHLIPIEQFSKSMRVQVEAALEADSTILLDSGVFALTNAHARTHNVSMDMALALAPDAIDGFGELFEKYCDIVTTYGDRLWVYVEVDQGGRENKIVTRTKLENMGFHPIPVYHPINDGWDYLDYLLARYDRICVGNLVQAAPSVRVRLLATIAHRLRAFPETWIHYLGVTPSPMLAAYAVRRCSADSSKWYETARGWNWIKDRAALVPVGELVPEAVGKACLEANNTNRAKLFALMAHVGHHLEANWREMHTLHHEGL